MYAKVYPLLDDFLKSWQSGYLQIREGIPAKIPSSWVNSTIVPQHIEISLMYRGFMKQAQSSRCRTFHQCHTCSLNAWMNLCSFFGVPLHKWVDWYFACCAPPLFNSDSSHAFPHMISHYCIHFSLPPQCIRTFTIDCHGLYIVPLPIPSSKATPRLLSRLHSSFSAVCRSIINHESPLPCLLLMNSSHLSPFCSDMHWTCRRNFIFILQKSAPQKEVDNPLGQ